MYRHQQAQYLFPLEAKWHKVKDKDIPVWCEKRGIAEKDIDGYLYECQRNPLAFFLPHGKERRDDQGNDGRAFTNDWEHDLILLRAGSKMGKTFAGAGKAGLFAGPCDPSWICFTQHGLKFREFPGRTEGILSSFSWDNVAILWETYRKLWPRDWLGPYAPNWGIFPGEEGKPIVLRFGDGQRKTIVLPCGVTLTMLCDTQSMVHWESRMADWIHMDEQLREEKADIAFSRFQTSQLDYNPAFMTWTPFMVDSRPDTGASGWVFSKREGDTVKGLTFSEYAITMDSVPDEIVTAKKKRKAYQMFILDPERSHNEKSVRSGRARYFAEPEVGGGIIISAWNPEIHMIEPFDVFKYNPTLFRYVDHGEIPCAALLIALMPWGDNVCFREYYAFGLGIGKNAADIVEVFSENQRRRTSEWEYEGQTWPVYEEVMIKMEFYASEMDTRSFSSKAGESGRTIGQAYNDWGCMVTQSSGTTNTTKDKTGCVDLLSEYFELDRDRPHINIALNREVPEMALKYGSPRMYLFDDLLHFRAEIEGWIRNPKTGKPIDKDDHLISCAKWHAARPRFYMGAEEKGEQTSDTKAYKPLSVETGY